MQHVSGYILACDEILLTMVTNLEYNRLRQLGVRCDMFAVIDRGR